jgi:hypothetical protein
MPAYSALVLMILAYSVLSSFNSCNRNAGLQRTCSKYSGLQRIKLLQQLHSDAGLRRTFSKHSGLQRIEPIKSCIGIPVANIVILVGQAYGRFCSIQRAIISMPSNCECILMPPACAGVNFFIPPARDYEFGYRAAAFSMAAYGA